MRTQNWTAIVIDFVIVVVGVFIGLQVSNWNDDKKELQRGEKYAERLIEELKSEYESTISILEYYEYTVPAGTRAYNGLTGKVEASPEQLLIDAYRATQYNWYDRRRSAYDEIVSAGALHLIPDNTIISTATRFYNTPIFEVMEQEGRSAEYRLLFRELIELHVQEDLLKQCGDQLYNGKFNTGMVRLSYDCKLTISDADIQDAISTLKTEPRILISLRRRTAELTSRVRDLTDVIESSGMNDFMARYGFKDSQ